MFSMSKKTKHSTTKKQKDTSERAAKDTGTDKYWDNITEEAAKGYRKEDDIDKILSEDQLKDDNERGDKGI